MAFAGECGKCGLYKIIDVGCSEDEMLCFDCISSCPDLQHQPNCRVVIAQRIEKNRRLATLHDLLAKQEKIIGEAQAHQNALEIALREINPCPTKTGFNHPWLESFCSLLDAKQNSLKEAKKAVDALKNTLKEIDPCLECKGRPRKTTCPICNGVGYNPKPSEEALNEKMPPPTY